MLPQYFVHNSAWKFRSSRSLAHKLTRIIFLYIQLGPGSALYATELVTRTFAPMIYVKKSTTSSCSRFIGLEIRFDCERELFTPHHKDIVNKEARITKLTRTPPRSYIQRLARLFKFQT